MSRVEIKDSLNLIKSFDLGYVLINDVCVMFTDYEYVADYVFFYIQDDNGKIIKTAQIEDKKIKSIK